MKKNISINISGIIFHIEEDGYEQLQKYLDSINSYFSSYEDSEEIIADIESRIAEIFLEKLSDGKQVVSAEDVAGLIKTMGNISDFEAMEEQTDFATENTNSQQSEGHTQQRSSNQQSHSQQQRQSSRSTGSRGLYRDLNHQVLGGVCSGLAHYINVDPIWIRVAFLFLLPAGGISLIAYFILWVVVPGSNTLEESESVKKLYRDPDDRVLGGVCSGLANFLNIDAIIIRIIFIVFIFGGGLGLIAYLILWAITPEATTITAKMQMKGEKVTLTNIDEKIKKQKTEEDFGPKGEGAFTKVLLFPFRLVGKVLSSISQALAPLMLFIVAIIRIFTGGIISIVGLSTMFALLVVAGVVFGIYNGDEWYYLDGDLSYIPYEVLNDTVPLAGLIALLVVLFIPFLYVFIAGITVIAKRKVMSSSFGWSVLGIWLIAILITAATVPNVIRDFREESNISFSENIEVSGGTLVLDIDNRFNYRRNNDFFLIDLDIRAGNSDQVTLDSRVYSRGRDRRDAEENARMVNYNYSTRDSVIIFDDMFDLGTNGEYRAQELEMTLYIPEGQPFQVKRGMDDLLGRFGRGYRWSTAYKNTWVFTGNGLVCTTCDDSDNGSASADDDFRSMKPLENINSIDISEGFNVYIEQGDKEQVVIESRLRRVNDISALTGGGELTLRAFGMSERQTQDIDIHITISDLTRLTVRDGANVDITGFDADQLEITLRNTSRLKFDGTTNTLDAFLDNDSRLTVLGEVNELIANLKDDSRLFATDAQIKSASLTTASDAWARLKVLDVLKVEARGRSTIRYEGNPELDIISQSNTATVSGY